MALRVAISQRVSETRSYSEDRDALSHDWARYLEEGFDALVYPIPNRCHSIQLWLDCLNPDLVVLSNGNDVGERPERDSCERQLIQWSIESATPLLGVCRGLQFINYFFSGGIVAVESYATESNHVACRHDISIIHPAFQALVNGGPHQVNSFHRQAVTSTELSTELVAIAKASDGTVEALCHPRHRILAVQWHPERSGCTSNLNTRLFSALMESGGFWNDK